MEYADYISLQKEKTCDPSKRKKWLNDEWDLKIHGFNKIFKKNIKYIREDCLCIGARTGQEVQALINLEKKAIGIDIVPCEPLVIEGDFHDLDFPDSSFDFIFSNVVDHALYPESFFKESIRVCRSQGYILFHLFYHPDIMDNDKYGVFDINDLQGDVLEFFKDHEIIHLKDVVYPEFSNLNKELLIQINK
jgi:SAM-dependent methyltransferase